MAKKKATDPIGIEWPTYAHRWWWMRWRATPQSRWHVNVVEYERPEFIRLAGQPDCISQDDCRNWEVIFAPAAPPPTEWC